MTKQARQKILMDLERLNATNADGCPACGRKFSLGDTAVLACGPWGDSQKLIHENEAVYDAANNTYVERRCFLARQA